MPIPDKAPTDKIDGNQWSKVTSNDVSPETIGLRIVSARKNRTPKLSQEGLGKLLGLTGAAVQTWESGRNLPPLDRLILIADELHVEIAWLAFGRGVKPSWAKRAGTETTVSDGPRRYDPVSGRAILLLPIEALIDDNDQLAAKKRQIVTHFPCSPSSFALTIWDKRNEPTYSPDDAIVIDPIRKPKPGEMILLADSRSGTTEIIFGKLRSVGGSPALVALNDEWDKIELPTGPLTTDKQAPVRLLGVLSEHTKPHV